VKVGRFVVASKNPDKIAEIEEVLAEVGFGGRIVRGADWPDVEEVGSTLEENALLKARAVARAVGLPALADDTGLEVEALGGAPGVHTSRFAGPNATYEENVDRLLAELAARRDRSATFRTVVALVFPDGRELVAEGVLEGTITDRRRGTSGFGYDPVFLVDGRTLAEIGPSEKNALSHRGRALRALSARITEES
jgi:XTP/dITP diphosphohydrolase